jgi:serine protease AprX
MDTTTLGMPGGVTKRTLQQVTALMVGLMMLLSTGVQASTPSLHLGKAVGIVVSKLSPSDSRPEQAVERVGGKVGKPLGIIDGFEATVPEKAVPMLAGVPGVRGIARNAKVRVAGVYGENSGVASSVYTEVTRASKAWGQATGKGITVAVIDTGVDTRGDLAGRVIGAADFSGENAPYQDSFGHGTFVAGLIAGTGRENSNIKGVAPDANIFSVKIAGKDGSTDLFRLLAALEFVAIHKDAFGIRVLNLSLGTDSTQSYLVDPLNFAVERVWNSGIAVVVAAGNNGKILKPADDPLVITVGAADDKTTINRQDDSVASFSGVGPTLSNGLAKPDVVASGRSVVSSRSVGSTVEANFPNAIIGNTYFKGSGTSFSSAIVAGTAALVVQKMWSLNPNQIKYRLMNTAKGVSGATAMQQGTGSIDAFNAVVSTDTTSANQGVAPAVGGGSLQGSSGTSCYRDANGACLSDADLIAASGFNTAAFYGSPWGGSAWNGSAWNGSAWNQSQWNGSAWNGSAWNGSAWNGSAWNGSAWNGSAWNGSAWNGSAWNGTDWAGSAWNGTVWGGSAWNGSAWNGSAWNGSAWNGSAWNGSAWNGSAWNTNAWQGEINWLGSHWN